MYYTLFCSCMIELAIFHGHPHKVEAPREPPLPWVWRRAPHEAQKIKIWDIILLFEATRSWDASWDDSNTTKWGTSWGARVQGTSQICMVLHDIMRCLILCIPLQEPNKTKNEVPQKFKKNMHHRDAVPRHHLIMREFWSKLTRRHFWQKRSILSKSEWARRC